MRLPLVQVVEMLSDRDDADGWNESETICVKTPTSLGPWIGTTLISWPPMVVRRVQELGVGVSNLAK